VLFIAFFTPVQNQYAGKTAAHHQAMFLDKQIEKGNYSAPCLTTASPSKDWQSKCHQHYLTGSFDA
jgi:hypothetical protein